MTALLTGFDLGLTYCSKKVSWPELKGKEPATNIVASTGGNDNAPDLALYKDAAHNLVSRQDTSHLRNEQPRYNLWHYNQDQIGAKTTDKTPQPDNIFLHYRNLVSKDTNDTSPLPKRDIYAF